jgi:hypothetical protein
MKLDSLKKTVWQNKHDDDDDADNNNKSRLEVPFFVKGQPYNRDWWY